MRLLAAGGVVMVMAYKNTHLKITNNPSSFFGCRNSKEQNINTTEQSS
jgi:hypothetical protein